jgi:phosphoenolpyruvate-protein phosphotransferase
MTRLTLRAPLSGVVIPIDAVPDPVFAEKMVGDGVSLDPVTSSLLAPCDGRIVQLHSAGHAVTIATDPGVEILMHIGLDTVQLKGRGFTARVSVGERVRLGDPLIDFDVEYLAAHAKSLLTPILITSLDRVTSIGRSSGTVTAGDPLLEIVLSTADSGTGATMGDVLSSGPLVITNTSGLHARPAAVLARLAKQFDADIKIRRGGVDVNARSVVGIMGLEINRGDLIEILASGADAGEAVAALTELVRAGLGESTAEGAVTASPAPTAPAVAPRAGPSDPNELIGVAASPGIAVGNTLLVRHEQLHVVEKANDPRVERQALDAALDRAKVELDVLQTRLEAEGAGAKAAIFAAHRELLDDPDLLTVATRAMDHGKSAAFGWQAAFMQHADRLAALKNELLAARANDLRDVGRRVLQKLTGVEAAREYPADTILIAEDLTPSDTATLNRAQVLGLCTTTGGASSHVAILARSLDIPLVAGIDPAALELPDGTPAIVDGTRGTLRLNPSAAEIARIHQLQQEQARLRRTEQTHAHEPATTRDGHRVEVAANIGGLADAEQAVSLGADAVGLLRSEFLFLHRATPPSEEEQLAVYSDIARVLGRDRKLIIRTLDVGGDKPLPYLPLPREDNPFLGERGVRVQLNRPELLRAQLRAILGASREGRVAVMFPMIALLEEWRAVRAILNEEQRRLGVPSIEAGIMVEVTSAALMADHFAREVDFFSIGTNDLTQYTLAMDRGHPRLAPQVDGLSPAALRLMDMSVRAARGHRRWTGVCGGIAGDPQAVPLLVGLGVEELSVNVQAIPTVKAQVRRLTMGECRKLAGLALNCATAAEVRALVPLDTTS